MTAANPCFPANGNRARLKWDPERPGSIIAAGAEQSVIRFDDDNTERCYPNDQFEPAGPRVYASLRTRRHTAQS